MVTHAWAAAGASCRGCRGTGRVAAAAAGCFRCERPLSTGAALGADARECRSCGAVNYLPVARPGATRPCPTCRGTGRVGVEEGGDGNDSGRRRLSR